MVFLDCPCCLKVLYIFTNLIITTMNTKCLFYVLLLSFTCSSCLTNVKTLPEPYITSPVTFSEKITYNPFSDNQVSKDGRILSYTNYYYKIEHMFDDAGFLIDSKHEYRSKRFGNSISHHSYIYDFDDEEKTYVYRDNNLEKVYNKEGNLERTYVENQKNNEYFYNSEGNLTRRIIYNNTNNIDTEYTYEYSGNLRSEYQYIYRDGTRNLQEVTVGTYDDYGVLTFEKDIYYNNAGDECVSEERHYKNGNLTLRIEFHSDETLYTEYVYNSHDDVIQEVHRTPDYKTFHEYRREYDQYGNPTLVVNYQYSIDVDGRERNKYYYIDIFNYIYNDGSKFVAIERYPEILKGRSASKNTSHSTTSAIDYSDEGNMNSSYSGTYSNGSNDVSSESSSSTIRDHEAEKRDLLNRTVGEYCQACKGTGKCHACNGTKIASSFGNTYPCNICDKDGNCSACGGTGKTSWNR